MRGYNNVVIEFINHPTGGSATLTTYDDHLAGVLYRAMAASDEVGQVRWEREKAVVVAQHG